MMEEPSVLDYVLEKLAFWKEGSIVIPRGAVEPPSSEKADTEVRKITILDRSWVSTLPVVLGLTAQFFLEPPGRSPWLGLVLYMMAGGLLTLLVVRKRWHLQDVPAVKTADIADTVSLIPLLSGLVFVLMAFFLFSGNRYTLINVSLWGTGFLLLFIALWQWSEEGWRRRLEGWWRQLRGAGFQVDPWFILLVLVFATAAFFRFYQLGRVPPEMFSDHAEKLLDVADVLSGQFRIFFPRNTGREGFQMYLTAAVSRLFDTGLSFMSLKLGTTLAGFFTLPYIYLLGKEYANRRVGLFAVFLAGVAYWPNVISRVALRFTLYPFFAAPVLYYLFRGLRRGSRNDFILAGIALGLGLHGYSPFRIMPLIVVAIGLLYAVHHLKGDGARRFVTAVLVVALISLLVFLPLLRYALDNYHLFSYRMRTRLTDLEQPLPGPAWKIFLTNLVDALIMFQWDNGQVWVHSIPFRPALGIVAGALFTLGLVVVIARYMRHRSWEDLAMVLLIPLFVLTSALSIAFPNENPSLNRTGGAIIPVFIIAGMALDGLFMTIKKRLKSPWGTRFSWGVVAVLMLISAAQNKGLVFEEYYHQFHIKSWNTSEIGAVVDKFDDILGEEDHAWVVPYPHWVDTRLVGIRAGEPLRDYALFRENIPATEEVSGPKLYIVKPEDTGTLSLLRSLYPRGFEREYVSDVPGRNFIMYYVVPEGKDQ